MKKTNPIKDKELLKRILEYEKKENERDYLFILMILHTGLLTKDLLELRVRDVKDKESLVINENIIPINKKLKKEIAHYVKDKPDYKPLFQSRQGINKAISRQEVHCILKNLGLKFEIDNLGAHSFRKTFGCELYKKTGDIILVQKTLGYGNAGQTYRYLGVDDVRKDSAILEIDYD